jgi:hypothetical protein
MGTRPLAVGLVPATLDVRDDIFRLMRPGAARFFPDRQTFRRRHQRPRFLQRGFGDNMFHSVIPQSADTFLYYSMEWAAENRFPSVCFEAGETKPTISPCHLRLHLP